MDAPGRTRNRRGYDTALLGRPPSVPKDLEEGPRRKEVEEVSAGGDGGWVSRRSTRPVSTKLAHIDLRHSGSPRRTGEPFGAAASSEESVFRLKFRTGTD